MMFLTDLNDGAAEKISGGAKAPKDKGAWVTAFGDSGLKDYVKVSYEGKESFVPFSGVKFDSEGELDFSKGKLSSLKEEGYEIVEVVADEDTIYTTAVEA
jgi:hypothetical protein